MCAVSVVIVTVLCVSAMRAWVHRLAAGESDYFRVLAVLRNNTGRGFNGTSGGIGVAEVAGDVAFNPVTMYHDVTWRPMVRELLHGVHAPCLSVVAWSPRACCCERVVRSSSPVESVELCRLLWSL
jgi:hypothetical protein